MTTLTQLASALNRRDEAPNQQLAQRIVQKRDTRAIAELVEQLSIGTKAARSDCIKVLYEIGERDPKLIAGYRDQFAALLQRKDNRLAWGAMTALDFIATVRPKEIFAILDRILAAADAGSVITRDHAVGILIKLSSRKPYAAKCLKLLMKQLESAPSNQFPMYAENAVAVMDSPNRGAFQKLLVRRMAELEKESQKRRIAKVLRKINDDG